MGMIQPHKKSSRNVPLNVVRSCRFTGSCPGRLTVIIPLALRRTLTVQGVVPTAMPSTCTVAPDGVLVTGIMSGPPWNMVAHEPSASVPRATRSINAVVLTLVSFLGFRPGRQAKTLPKAVPGVSCPW